VAQKKEEQLKKEQLLLAKEEQKKQIAYFQKQIKDVQELSPEGQTLALPPSTPPTAA
jgi:hypothetical protein